MNVTDSQGLWMLEHGQITNRKTGEVRSIKSPPTAASVAHITEAQFIAKCSAAFACGEWK